MNSNKDINDTTNEQKKNDNSTWVKLVNNQVIQQNNSVLQNALQINNSNN